MRKEEFLLQLRKMLKKLPPDEVNDALEYYEEYLDEAGPENEEAVIASLGSPGRVASQIMAQYAVKQMTIDPSVKKGLSTIWIVLLAIFASPIAIPIAVAIAAIIVSLVVAIFSVILALGAAAVSIAAGGIASIFVGFCLIIQSLPTALFYIGCGLFLGGAGVIASFYVGLLSKKAFNGIAKLFSKLLPGRNLK